MIKQSRIFFYWISLTLNEGNRYWNLKAEERKGALELLPLEGLTKKNIKEYTPWPFFFLNKRESNILLCCPWNCSGSCIFTLNSDARLLWIKNPQIEIKCLSKYSVNACQLVLCNHLSSDCAGNIKSWYACGVCSGIYIIPHSARL